MNLEEFGKYPDFAKFKVLFEEFSLLFPFKVSIVI